MYVYIVRMGWMYYVLYLVAGNKVQYSCSRSVAFAGATETVSYEFFSDCVIWMVSTFDLNVKFGQVGSELAGKIAVEG